MRGASGLMKKRVVVELKVGQLPALSVGFRYELVRIFHVGHLHVGAIPIELLASVELEASVGVLASELVGSDRDVTHKNGFSEWPRVIKRRGKSLMFV